MLVYIQNPAVTFFGSESYWRKNFDRKVNEDARALIILAPKHPVLLAYDIYDTAGRESPQKLLERGVGMKLFEVKGSLKRDYLRRVIDRASSWGINVVFKPLSFFNAGYINTAHRKKMEICLKEGMTQEENFSVLVHELAHLLLGHTGHKEIVNLNSGRNMLIHVRKLERNIEELEAESVSYLITYKLKLETRSAEYMAGYIKHDYELKFLSYESIIRTADNIEKMFL
jgi:hypothetical protein